MNTGHGKRAGSQYGVLGEGGREGGRKGERAKERGRLKDRGRARKAN